MLNEVKRLGAKRVVIDSLVGFEMALAPAFRLDFRESLYRMIGALIGLGVTVLSTVELPEPFTDLLFSPLAISFLTHDIVRLRCVEIEGQLRKVLTIIKMRGGNHSKDICEYQITPAGVVIGSRLQQYRGIVTGIPARTGPLEGQTEPSSRQAHTQE